MRALTVSLVVLATTIVGGAVWQITHRSSVDVIGAPVPMQVSVTPETPEAPVTPPPPPPPVLPKSPSPVATKVVAAPSEQDGYNWAANRGVYSHRECPNSPMDFSAGCHAYVIRIQTYKAG